MRKLKVPEAFKILQADRAGLTISSRATGDDVHRPHVQRNQKTGQGQDLVRVADDQKRRAVIKGEVGLLHDVDAGQGEHEGDQRLQGRARAHRVRRVEGAVPEEDRHDGQGQCQEEASGGQHHQPDGEEPPLVRAEPVGALYELARVVHVGVHAELERECSTWIPGMPSPNRMDG